MNNGRPLTVRKKVQLLTALTILAWATQTLFAQWSRGAQTSAAAAETAETPAAPAAPAFVPREPGVGSAATLELRAEARVYGGEVKLRQVCRWSDADAATFAPVADLVIGRLDTRRPYKVLEVREVRRTLEEAGINVALVRFAGPVECTISRTDAELKEGEALEQWVKAQEGAPATQAARPAAAAPAARDAAADDAAVRTLRDILLADLSVRLSIPQDQIVLSLNPQDEGAANLPEAQFKFNVQPRRVRGLGDVAWDVTITGPAGDSRKAQVRGSARAWQNQVVVARPVARRQVIQVTDLARKRTMVDQLSDAPLLKAEQVVGQMAARDLQAGTVMTAPLVEAVPLAKPGQFITVTLVRGTVKIKGVGKALESGSYGQTIRVKNEATKDIYQVVLTGPQEASMAPQAVISEDKGVASALD